MAPILSFERQVFAGKRTLQVPTNGGLLPLSGHLLWVISGRFHQYSHNVRFRVASGQLFGRISGISMLANGQIRAKTYLA
jgi:hypothetical protein